MCFFILLYQNVESVGVDCLLVKLSHCPNPKTEEERGLGVSTMIQHWSSTNFLIDFFLKGGRQPSES